MKMPAVSESHRCETLVLSKMTELIEVQTAKAAPTDIKPPFDPGKKYSHSLRKTTLITNQPADVSPLNPKYLTALTEKDVRAFGSNDSDNYLHNKRCLIDWSSGA